jgi:endonuclease/exonuclease/phosphatase family metal-dependent hydrolase
MAARTGAVTQTFLPPSRSATGGFYDGLWAFLLGTTAPGYGAMFDSGSRKILGVTLHTSQNGDERRAEASALRDSVRQTLSGTRVDAVLVGGDFNLHGEREALDIVRDGIVVGGSPLTVVDALQLDGRTNATHKGRFARATFPPGRLDWLLFSGSSLTLVKSFVFEAADLTPGWLRRHGLEAADSDAARTSDHRPIVADFRWTR